MLLSGKPAKSRERPWSCENLLCLGAAFTLGWAAEAAAAAALWYL